ncbi:uncharacterized protein PgNI_09478 [Pyricularia grisea]|uniref:Uncharacterized protein n=1 Tax=Pyricularia grisea TaxID=148305 RepID=A0A6P8ASF5_PYRGI|nr:uncharacterized protein PgNI_09478 [Pyricularia grisea]TLD05032.1 hypothetical protein PgNI_09478 [Pyricularia grisea]
MSSSRSFVWYLRTTDQPHLEFHRLMLFLLPNLVARPRDVLRLPELVVNTVPFKLAPQDAVAVADMIRKFFSIILRQRNPPEVTSNIANGDGQAIAMMAATRAQEAAGNMLQLGVRPNRLPSIDDMNAPFAEFMRMLEDPSNSAETAEKMRDTMREIIDRFRIRSNWGRNTSDPAGPAGSRSEIISNIKLELLVFTQDDHKFKAKVDNATLDQLCSERVGKTSELLETIQNTLTEDGKPPKVLVFSRFQKFLHILHRAAMAKRQLAPLLFSDELNRVERREMIHEFSRRDGKHNNIILITQQATTIGLLVRVWT